MEPKLRRWCIGLVLLLITLTRGEEGSLQSALNAVNRRQHDLSEYPPYVEFYSEGGLSHYTYPSDEDDGIAFLAPGGDHNHEHKTKNVNLERALLNYLEEEGLPEYDAENINKRISSSFRERVEEDKTRQRERLAELLLNKLQNSQDTRMNDEYIELAEQMWDKYKKVYPEAYDLPRGYSSNDIRKRFYPYDYYPNLGLDTVGMKKRSRYFEPDGPSDSLYLLNYTPREEIFNRLQEQGDNSELDYNWNKFQRERKLEAKQRQEYLYPMKRFSVTKRSSNYYPIPYTNEFTHQHKRSPKKDTLIKTDPKVTKDLSNIFNPETKQLKEKSKNIKPATKPKKTEHASETELKQKPKVKKDNETKTPPANTKEVAPNIHKSMPLQVKKKSIDWSNYFGLDRRKKSDDLDNEWLMERYHKAVAMAAKRSESSPDLHNKKEDLGKLEKKSQNTANGDESAKIGEMDSKLKSIEDSIVDEALKYTGAHAGEVDSKEIQEVKDRVIAQLAAAYSLEKMRRALGEYKQSIERERNRLKEAAKDEQTFMEEKRISVPRKSANDEEREKADADNNIKCAQGSEDCEEQSYRTPTDILEQTNWEGEGCPKIQRACSEISSSLGQYGLLFEQACAMHQMCLLCGDNSWFAPTRQCNSLFLTKANEICSDDVECQRFARHSVRYLLDINRSLKAEPVDRCELICPVNRR